MNKYNDQWMRDHAATGVRLADEAADYFLAFPPAARERQIQIWISTMRDLMVVNHQIQKERLQ